MGERGFLSLPRRLPLSDSLGAYSSRGSPLHRVTVVAHVQSFKESSHLVSASVSVTFETWTEVSE